MSRTHKDNHSVVVWEKLKEQGKDFRAPKVHGRLMGNKYRRLEWHKLEALPNTRAAEKTLWRKETLERE